MEKVVSHRTVTAIQRGWRRRTDMGPDAWETENGTLYRHETHGVPIFNVLDIGEMFPHLKDQTQPPG